MKNNLLYALSLSFYHHLLFYRTDILDIGESTLDVGEQIVGKTTRRRNDRLPFGGVGGGMGGHMG